MRAFWIVVFGLAGFATSVATSSASKVEYSEKELDDYCYTHAGVYKTDRENYWSCEIGSGKSTVHIDCNKAGKCTMWNEVVFTQPRPTRTNIVGGAAAASTQISGGGTINSPKAARTNIAVVSSGSATASTAMAVSPSKPVRPNAATAASPNLGAAFMSSGRATLRPQ